jgi:hypothetical protein
MLRYLLDTNHLTLHDHANVTVWRHSSAHSWGRVGIRPVTVEEHLRGRLAALTRHQQSPLQVMAYSRLVDSLNLFAQFPLVPFDQGAESRYTAATPVFPVGSLSCFGVPVRLSLA